MWTCPVCGNEGNTSLYCDRCGALQQKTNLTPPPPQNPEPTTTFDNKALRFMNKETNPDGSITIYDKETGYTIIYTEEAGYVAYNNKGKKVYEIAPNGDAVVYTIDEHQGYNIKGKNLSIEDMSLDMEITNEQKQYYIRGGNLVKFIRTDPGVTLTEVFDENGCSRCDIIGKDEEGDFHQIDYCNPDGIIYKTITDNGSIYFYGDDNSYIKLHPDGTYFDYDNDVSGTYVENPDGDFTFTDQAGNITYYGKYGNTTKKINVDGSEDIYDHGKVITKIASDGTIYTYDHDLNVETINKNGIKRYAIINHIEYDEAQYDKILTTLIELADKKAIFNSSFSDIEDSFSNLPDKYSGNSNMSSDIAGHIELINSLGEMTNYSLLAYQTCDNDLKSGLERLIDSLFGDSEKAIGEEFKKAINYTIEEQEGIINYKKDTNYHKTLCICELLLNDEKTTFLSADELTKFMEDNNIRNLDSLVIAKSSRMINGVEYDTYSVINADKFNSQVFFANADAKMVALGKVDTTLLEFVRSGGSKILFFSDATVDNGSYDKNEQYQSQGFGGYCNSENRNMILCCNSSNPLTSVHEFGHALDFMINYYINKTTQKTITTVDNDFKLNTSYGEKNLYQAASDDIKTLFDPLNLLPGEYTINNSEEHIYAFSNYSKNELINEKAALEFFAEAFKMYYSDDEETRMRYQYLIPETFDYIDAIIEWVGEQNANQ